MPGFWIVILTPLFRYSINREAYVLRIGGRHFGPVLTRRVRHLDAPTSSQPDR